MYFGTYKRTLDEKGRLQLPVKLVSKGISKLYILKGFEGCLSFYNQESFDQLTAKLANMDFFNKEERDFIRGVAASVHEIEIDAHGRILISKQILEDYEISKDVTLIGVFDHFELWDQTSYAKYSLGTLQTFDKAGRS